MTSSTVLGALFMLIVATCTLALQAHAHPPVATAALVDVSRDGSVEISVVHDTLAFALNDTSARISDAEMYRLLEASDDVLAEALADGLDRFTRGFGLEVDGHGLPFQIVHAPDVRAVRQWQAVNPRQALPCKQDFVVSAQLPASAGTMRLRFPETLAETLLVVHRPGFEPTTYLLNPGERSAEIQMGQIGDEGAGLSQAQPQLADGIGAIEVAWRFVRLGFRHIIPQGPDHCLFVLGLFLLKPRVRPVLLQISTFTMAHTITLTLTSLGLIGMPGRVVEPTIAASIVFVAVENLWTDRLHGWRPAVAFVFGLVHGMGVATSFHEARFPPGQLVSSLAAFTVGVEAGHVTVLLVAFSAIAWTAQKEWYRQRIAIPMSLVIAVIALYWLAQRSGIATNVG